MKAAKTRTALGRLKDKLTEKRDTAKKNAEKARDTALADAKKLSGDAKSAAEKAAEVQYTTTVRTAYENCSELYRQANIYS